MEYKRCRFVALSCYLIASISCIYTFNALATGKQMFEIITCIEVQNNHRRGRPSILTSQIAAHCEENDVARPGLDLL